MPEDGFGSIWVRANTTVNALLLLGEHVSLVDRLVEGGVLIGYQGFVLGNSW